MRTPFALALVLSLVAVACGAPNSNADAGDAGPPCTDCNDSINLHCTSAGGEEAAAACNTRLASLERGATFFIGDRRTCYPNPNSPMCRPLCQLSAMNFENMGGATPSYCTFNAMTPGCKINESQGYTVVVESMNGRRATAGVGNDGTCAGQPGERRRWALVGLEDLRTAARCAAVTPASGFDGPTAFVSCDADPAACTMANRTTCQERMFRAGMTTYMRSFCTRTCSADAECGSAGRCANGDCVHRCGGECGLSCPNEFTCVDGACLPTPLR